MVTAMITIELNINDTVKVKLTAHGKALAIKAGYDNRVLTIDKDGYSSWQLWVLMSVLGEHLYNGATNAIESNIIRIEA